MLQIKGISKKYKTGDLIQTALDNVSLNLRDNEFVAILGPSGSGKTTLLNVIGGLDRYDSGDLVIKGISTKKYKDRDWDSYRNHTIGFVFQSYNLIPHQSILANVELALTISGIKRSERRKRAKEALEKVGLGNQLHKRPNQMSGGQMQRVAIARALVNNPDILLADEPTGALDTETSVQVMELLKEVAKDRLVVMVTHNPDLAREYANRIVKLRDGKITDDSNPYDVDEKALEPAKHKNMGKSSMSFLTSLSLSFNNLRTKKGRTLLTSFAGSIGIIGIAMILSFSNGVNNYINDIQKSTMTSYPITITEKTMDLSSIMTTGRDTYTKDEVDHGLDRVYANNSSITMASTMTTSITENNLTDFKKYLDDPTSKIHDYLGENGVAYTYDVKFGVYTKDTEDVLINTNGITIEEKKKQNSIASVMSVMASASGSPAYASEFEELLPGADGALVGSIVTDNYDVVYGKLPESYDEVLLVLDKNNEVPIETLYQLGMLPSKEYLEITENLQKGGDIEVKSADFSYDELCGKTFWLIPACDMYQKQEGGSYKNISGDADAVEELTKSAQTLKIVGIIRPKADASNASLACAVGYTKALTQYVIEQTDKNEAVIAQRADADVNVLNGYTFAPSDDESKAADALKYLQSLTISQKAEMFSGMMKQMYATNPQMLESISDMQEVDLANMLDSYLANPEQDMLVQLYDAYISAGTYEETLGDLGVISADAPSSISLYADSFEDKDNISVCIDEYNAGTSEENKIVYTDYVGLLMSSVTTIVDVISYVLIAFVAVSLVVSSIMIGIITYISVLERTKEIGILRAIGASKHNISQVFNAETFIIGLCAGLIGVGVTLLLLLPTNAIIHSLTGISTINAALPPVAAAILVALSMVLTLIGGIIPSRKAAKKDPVTALRTE